MVMRRMRVPSSDAIGRRPGLSGGMNARANMCANPQHRFGLYDKEGGSPAIEPPTRQNPETPVRAFLVRILKARTWLAALQDYQLLPEAKIVCNQQRLWSDSRSKRPQANSEALPLPLLWNRQEADAVQCRQ